MTIYYIDDRATGANNGDADAALGPDENGIYQNAWQSIADAEAVKPYVGGDEVRFVVGSGPYREAFTMAKNGLAGNPIIWRTTEIGKKVEISAADVITGPWVQSTSNPDEYYLDDTITEPKCGTVNGYYRGSSAEAERERQAPGSLDIDSFGWGDNDSIGGDRLYVRVAAGDPSSSNIVMSQRDIITTVNWLNHDFEDLIYSYGNVSCVDPRGQNWVYRRCAFIFPDFTGLLTGSTNENSGARLISCVFYWCGHRCTALATTSAGKFELYNCTDYGSHLFTLMTENVVGETICINNISYNNEAGSNDVGNSAAQFTESNNLWYPRMTAGGGDLGYVNGANWPTTDVTDIPSNIATNRNETMGGTGRANYPELQDPKLANVLENDFENSTFNFLPSSPAKGAGIDWWTAIGESEPLDYYGNPLQDSEISMGAAFTPIPFLNVTIPSTKSEIDIKQYILVDITDGQEVFRATDPVIEDSTLVVDASSLSSGKYAVQIVENKINSTGGYVDPYVLGYVRV